MLGSVTSGSAAADAAASFALAAVVIERSEPDERRDLFAGQVAELWHEGIERAACDGSHAFDGPESLVADLELGQCLASLVDVAIE
jgi:hypothetical protein